MTKMNNQEFAYKAMSIVKMETLYVMGGFGQVLTDARKKKLIKQYDYNKEHESDILAASNTTFAFDCIGLVKGILWGFTGDSSQQYGGAVYKSNGVPDCNEKKMLSYCTDVSTDMSHIAVGEFLWLEGHCGIYAGEGLVVECTPAWENKVQVTKLSDRTWLKHGKLKWVEYITGPTIDDVVDDLSQLIQDYAIMATQLEEQANELLIALEDLLEDVKCLAGKE